MTRHLLAFVFAAVTQAAAQLAPTPAPGIAPAARSAYQSSLTIVPATPGPSASSRSEWHQGDPADSL